MALFSDQLQQVVRRLGRAPLFTAITLFTLAIAIGANTVVFSVVDGVLLKPLPYPHPEELIGVWHTAPGIGIKELNMSPSIYFIDREQSTTLQDIGVYQGDSLNVTGAGQPEHVDGVDVTDGTLPLLGVKPVLGRLFTRRDDTAGAPETVLLSYAYWQHKFGGSPSAIGRTMTADGKPREIIGVLPRGFQFLDRKDDALILPMQWDRNKTKLGNFSYSAIARLKPGVTMQQASTDIARLLPVSIRSFPAPDGFSPALFEKANFQIESPPAQAGCRRRRGQCPLGPDGLHRHGAAGGLRQRRKSAAGARRRTPPGVGDPLGSRCGLEAHHHRPPLREHRPRVPSGASWVSPLAYGALRISW